MATQKFYQDMSAEEQLQWVQGFSEVLNKGGERIAVLAKDSRAVWTRDDQAMMQRLFGLLGAWPWAQSFCEQALRFGDYSRRAYRLPVYIEKVKAALADGLVMTDSTGKATAVVLPGAPLRRRGRPTKKEMAARLRGEVVLPTDDGPETRKRRTIARMLGLEVVNGEAQREKNNAELKAEREARRAREEKMNPSLFDKTPSQSPRGEKTEAVGEAANAQIPPLGEDGRGLSPCAQLMNDSYEARMAQDKLHLDQLAWLMSKPLQERVKLVQSQRTEAESASERAKMLAEMGGKQEEIAEYAEQAKVATEAYLQTYADVDEELAVLHKRLYLDLPLVEAFKRRFMGVDIEKIQYITRPYYEKVKKESPEIDVRIRTIIEQENPEYAAKMKAEQEKKEELQQLHRYIMRTDKPASDERVKTMTERIERVRQLAGDEVADSYLPVLEKTKEENTALNKAKAEKKAADKPADIAEAKPRPTKQGKQDEEPAVKTTGTKTKAASKREHGDAGISHAEREQARRDNGKKPAKTSTKQESNKTTKAQSKK